VNYVPPHARSALLLRQSVYHGVGDWRTGAAAAAISQSRNPIRHLGNVEKDSEPSRCKWSVVLRHSIVLRMVCILMTFKSATARPLGVISGVFLQIATAHLSKCNLDDPMLQ
jgi:hypothetical protein